MSSTTTLTNFEKEEALSSGTPTPARNSIEKVRDEEEQPPSQEPEDVEPLSRARVVLLMLGLCLSMFLVALDFVVPRSKCH
jgi:hypothetical protein